MLAPINILDVKANINAANLERLRYGSVTELQNALDDALISLTLLHKVDVKQKDRQNFILLIDTLDQILVTELKFEMTFKDANLFNIQFSKKRLTGRHKENPIEVFFDFKIKERPLDKVKEYVLRGGELC